MRHPSLDPSRRSRRLAHRPSTETLEARRVLSSGPPMTLAMDPTADGMIDGMATNHVLVVDGQATPGALIQFKVGQKSGQNHADKSGRYQIKVPLAAGDYRMKVQAKDKAGQVSSASLSVTMGDAVLAWESTMIDVIKGDIANVGLASRTLAMVSGAVYDAVNDIEHTGSVYKINVQAPAGASPTAAASEAAYTVLSALDPSMQPLLDVTMAQSIAAVPSEQALNGGMQVGLEVAQGILAWRANDGSAATVPYVPGTAPGDWRPTPPTYQVAWGPEWGDVATFGITKPASAFLPPAPPALNSPAYAAALNQVESLGALNSTTRTPEETQIGYFWSYDDPTTGTPVVHYDQIAEDIALQMHNSLTQNARMFGLVNVALGDAGITAWDSKYTYNRWRPITAIPLANTDGNPATTADPTWEPLGAPGAPGQPSFTPAFPSYVSGHATFGAALFTTLTEFYGTNNVHFTIGSDQLPGVTRSYSSFSQASMEERREPDLSRPSLLVRRNRRHDPGHRGRQGHRSERDDPEARLISEPNPTRGFGRDAALPYNRQGWGASRALAISGAPSWITSLRKTCSTRSTHSLEPTRSRPSARPKTTSSAGSSRPSSPSWPPPANSSTRSGSRLAGGVTLSLTMDMNVQSADQVRAIYARIREGQGAHPAFLIRKVGNLGPRKRVPARALGLDFALR